MLGLKAGRVAFDGRAADLTPAVLTDIYGAEDWSQTIRPADEDERRRVNAAGYPTTWRPPSFFGTRGRQRLALAAALAYLVVSATTLNIDPQRALAGFGRAVDLFVRMVPPDFSRGEPPRPRHGREPADGVRRDAGGVVLSVPLGIAAARNLAPRPVYLAARGLIVVGRTFHEVIIAIFCVKLFGFGPVAGLITLGFSSTIFLAKMLAEDIENVRVGPIEALRATGAGFGQVVVYAVVPQVLTRTAGTAIYRLDANVRHSTIVGIVGRRRHRPDALGVVLALRLRLRRGDPAVHHRAGRAGRMVQRLGAEEAPVTAELAGRYPTVWRRRSRRESIVAWLWVAVVAFVSAWSVSALDIEWLFFKDAHEQAIDLVERMWPPRWSYLPKIVAPLIETIHIATLGTAIAVVLSLPLAFLVRAQHDGERLHLGARAGDPRRLAFGEHGDLGHSVRRDLRARGRWPASPQSPRARSASSPSSSPRRSRRRTAARSRRSRRPARASGRSTSSASCRR